ncbi:putative pentatricopeptide repeat-containing protein At1g16830 isoform X1 [Corylus avellana]|uniref:putative pentatricopeptide repeat-containing protein At1g16830 isoform X1 n=1 Tax=Corylus avellana TaxID=13451 RepID=UPI00286D03C6|nr:putative pentatricopeptide repeat-containing protein At1g16830 isoform X1 [Corylus avellana]XP_059452344.1 putative pentatricopeptide repeat-containing protein At1g16830 isoform X1 [Corylus avellana]XP_059452345.1 putative pentatricopeptide repeat-containing protein At1g16830 isoform X1 [Corylus avellana]XP_059452348.1 putative pentatricopeptide repeat-containing protein At1g16830 isoform X1 [Corylus avellana]XP_059452349.1 putative pentatricopeptide repeat-containing protein At1g16830 isofo
MVWKCYRWNLLLSTSNQLFITTPPLLLPLRFLSTATVCVTNQTPQKIFRGNQDNPEKNKRFFTHQTVHSTLLDCPSDLIALSFFLWFAKQPNYFHNTTAFDHMVSVVKRLMEQYKTVGGVVRGLECVGCVTKARTFLLLLRIYWRGGMYDMVFEAFEEMRRYGFEPNTFARNVIMDVLFKIGRADVAIKVLKETQLQNFLTFNIALCNLCKLNDLVRIREVFRMMLGKGYHLNAETFEMLLNCFCKMSKLVEAYQVLGRMITLGIPIHVNVWSILVNGFCRLRKFDIACDLVEKMVRTGCFPNVVTYTTLIKGFMESKMVDDAIQILNIMESRGHAPDLVLCNVLIDSLSKVGRYDDALDVFVSLQTQNMAPDSYTLCSLLTTICLSRRFSLLPKLVLGIVVEADLVVCNALLNIFGKAGFPYLSVELYNDMLGSGFTPDKYSFVGLLSGLCEARRIDEAVNAYHGILMNYPGQDAHIHTVIIDGLIKVGKFYRAIRLFRKAIAEKYPLDVVSYTVAFRGLLKSGRTGEACTLYNQMKEAGISPNAHMYNVMLSLFCRQRDLKMVIQLLQEMIGARIELSCNTSFRLCNFLCRSCDSSSAVTLLTEMRDLGLIPDEAMCALLSNRHVQHLKVDGKRYSLLKGYLENDLLVDTYGSEDLSDVAASVV